MQTPIIIPKFIRKRHCSSGHIFLLLLIAFCGYFWYFPSQQNHIPLYSRDSPESLFSCEQFTNTGSMMDWICIKKSVWVILNSHSTQKLMEALTDTRIPETISSNCHPIAHFIGMETFRRSLSIEDALLKCTNSCGSGCIHGVIAGAVLKDLGETYSSEDIEHADMTTIRKIGKKYCQSGNPMCHAMGHILLMSDQSYTGALDGCDAIANSGWSRESCYQGVFMQMVWWDKEWLFPGQVIRTRSVDDYAYPCSLVDPTRLHACFHYLPLLQSELFREKHIRSLAERYRISEHVCESFFLSWRSDCFLGIGFFADNEVFPEDSPIDIRSRCATLRIGSDQNACDRGIMDHYMYRKEYARMLSYCHILGDTPRKTSCYDSVFDSIESEAPEEHIEQICNLGAMSECREQYHRYQKSSS